MALAYIEKVTQNRVAFENKVRVIASNLGIMPDWLMVVMYAESHLKHLAQSDSSSAVGLIQFTSSARANLGVTATQLLSMSNVQQLDYVQKYLSPYKGKMKSVYDVYLAVFAPVGIGKSDGTILYSSPSASYTANKTLDRFSDGKISVGDVKNWFDKFIPASVAKDSINSNFVFWFVVVVVIVVKRKAIKKLFL